ncbi:CBS domain-containing protein [Clostridium neuense]|uniref:CBS domain-containing protein n=1 Tax=Clostridium neuense TaxID=1728934 RepID=A0ABW8TIK0_9CLOT
MGDINKNKKSNAEKFIVIYNELDRYMRKCLDEDDRIGHTDLVKRMTKRNKTFAKNKDDLMLFARLRNSIIHNPYNREIDPIAEPHDKILDKYKEIRDKVLNPPIALDSIAVKGKNIYSVTVDEFAFDVMNIMRDNNYTHVPVIDGDFIIGVFSESTVFSYMVANEGSPINRDTKIKEFEEFIPLDRHVSEFFSFVHKDTLVVEIEEIFQRKFNGKKRLSVIFITETGRVKEKILGLITPWDVAAK